MKVDLSKYETVKERKVKFYSDNPDGRIEVELINIDKILDHALFKASIFKTKEDQEKRLPSGIGYAHEIRDKEIKISNQGKEYESVNFTSWCENAEESAVGRALDNAGYSGNKKCSRNEIIKAQQQKVVIQKSKEQTEREALFNEIVILLQKHFPKSSTDAEGYLFKLHEIKMADLLDVNKVDMEELKEISISLHGSLNGTQNL